MSYWTKSRSLYMYLIKELSRFFSYFITFPTLFLTISFKMTRSVQPSDMNIPNITTLWRTKKSGRIWYYYE